MAIARWNSSRLYGLPIDEERALLRYAFLDVVDSRQPGLLDRLSEIFLPLCDGLASSDNSHPTEESWTEAVLKRWGYGAELHDMRERLP